ncbi:MAG TPA: Stp1/IreP family PP2C-type Ser/Thr phosphatase [Thermodesulfobacteriota bacterium]|nr:Stp1/IreP family PP2C-type Ser/Thr phosphatase [Thermodesulfobacteriota bacterium]
MPEFKSYGKTDVGLVRKNNEDAFVAAPDLGLWVVSDGMGGEESGETASRIMVETSVEVFSESGGSADEEGRRERIQRVFAAANERILAWAEKNDVKRMGCTGEVLACVIDGSYILGHVGDSRTYRFRDGRLKQLTVDHSLVQKQIEEGLITAEEARRSPLRNVILRAVGVERNLAVDLLRGKANPGDIFLLCSDGLTGMVSDPAIEEILARPWDLARKTDELIEKAKAAGGLDNITVVLCEIQGL